MEAGVENGDLRHWTQQFRDDLHAFQFGATVERRKNGSLFDRRLNLSGHDRRLEMLHATVNHPVPHHINIGRAGNRLRLAAPQTLQQALNRFATRARRCQVFCANAMRILDRGLSLVIYPLDLPLPSTGGWIVWQVSPNLVKTTLLAAGAGV